MKTAVEGICRLWYHMVTFSGYGEGTTDKDQIILIYCRSGNRSKQAAQKLADMGYTNIYEFGGINTWTGEIVTE